MSSRETARRFHFLREIASGGFGSVYLAKVMHADGFSRLVAVKLLKAHWSDNEEVTGRIRDEARLLGLLRHRNIVDVIDLTSIDGRTAVVMEYLESVDFRTVISHLSDTQGRMPVRAALEAMAACASALDAAYNRPPVPGEKPLRVIHRDIKPSNLMVDETGMVKVLDFGVARSEIENRESHTEELQFGSVDYMAPERLFFEPETPSSDVYSLGATLYEVLALDKLGKARGRPEKHAAHLHDRLAYLRKKTGMAGTGAVELESLLLESLDYEHENRPSAAAWHQRARALSRLMPDEDLGSWAERVLPPLVRAAHKEDADPDALSDAVLTEDSVAVSRGPAVFTGIRNMSGGDIGLDVPDPGALGTPGDQLRRGALSELVDAGEIVPSPATGAPAVARQRATLIPENADWYEMPTRVGPSELLAAELPVGFGAAPRDPGGYSELPIAPANEAEALEYTASDEPTSVAVTPLIEAASARIEPLTASQAAAALLDAPEPSLAPLSAPPSGLVVREDAARTPTPAPSAADEPAPLPVYPPVPKDTPVSDEALDRAMAVAKASAARSAGRSTPVAPRPAAPAPAPEPAVAPQPAAVEPAHPAPQPVLAPVPAPLAAVAPAKDPVAPDPSEEREPWEDADDEVAPGPSMLPYAIASGCLVFVGLIGVVVAGIVADVGGLRTRLLGEAAAAGEPVAAAPAAEVAPAPAGGVSFRSDAAGTARLNVECVEGKAGEKGARAAIAAEAVTGCVVTAILEDRSRLRATLDEAGAGSWVCFAGGAETCTRE